MNTNENFVVSYYRRTNHYILNFYRYRAYKGGNPDKYYNDLPYATVDIWFHKEHNVFTGEVVQKHVVYDINNIDLITELWQTVNMHVEQAKQELLKVNSCGV